MEKRRELRRRKVLTLRELEEVSGVSYATVWRLESGRATEARPSTIRKLARALGVEPEELIAGSEGGDDA